MTITRDSLISIRFFACVDAKEDYVEMAWRYLVSMVIMCMVIHCSITSPTTNKSSSTVVIDHQRQNCSNEKTLCVLCFGDSITQGFYGFNGIFHPYTISLRAHLAQKYPDVYIRIFTRGLGGDMVHGKMKERLERELSRENFDIVLIMAGINDLVKLTYEINQDLFEEILDLHQMALDHGALRTLAMTMLPARPAPNKVKFLPTNVFEALRIQTNAKIRSITLTNSTNEISVCDTETCFPPQYYGSYYWQPDHVHPSPIGYDVLGKCIFSCLVGEVDFLLDVKELNRILEIV